MSNLWSFNEKAMEEAIQTKKTFDFDLRSGVLVHAREIVEALTGTYGGTYLPPLIDVIDSPEKFYGQYLPALRLVKINLNYCRNFSTVLDAIAHECAHHVQCVNWKTGFPPDFPLETAERARKAFKDRKQRDGTYQEDKRRNDTDHESFAFWVQDNWAQLLGKRPS